ncbi:MAG: hypothetical protein NC307_15720 [Roseburia sp.]|nr:hypothetical protein [Roseburia sp.]
MRTLATDIATAVIFFLGLVLPLCGWVWIAFCKYVWHFRKGCDNRSCWYRCKKCPHLHSEQLEMRIALLEGKYPSGHAYIRMLRKRRQMYLDNPDLDRETESQMIHRLAREAKRNG